VFVAARLNEVSLGGEAALILHTSATTAALRDAKVAATITPTSSVSVNTGSMTAIMSQATRQSLKGQSQRTP
jgi:hypothetical protein